jgi:hypothetical protein
MKRREFMTGLLAGVALAGPATAQDVAGDIIAQLLQQGFTDVTSSTTWLGRVRILAQRDNDSREIVVNPRTGEILRDVWLGRRDGTKSTEIIRNGNSGKGNGGHGGGNGSGGGDDDDDDDDEESDNSGSGGGNGGSGGGNGGSSGGNSGSGGGNKGSGGSGHD